MYLAGTPQILINLMKILNVLTLNLSAFYSWYLYIKEENMTPKYLISILTNANLLEIFIMYSLYTKRCRPIRHGFILTKFTKELLNNKVRMLKNLQI